MNLNTLMETSTKKIKIVLADDHPLLRYALKGVLEKIDNFEMIGEAGNGEEAIELVLKHCPDILILDISMPKVNGLEVIRRIKAERSDTLILVLTVHDETEHIIEALNLGASGYLTKGIFDDELVQAIKSVIAGEIVLTAEVSQQILSHSQRHIAKSISIDLIENLSFREIEIIKLVAKGHRNKEIAEMLNLSYPTVKTYLSNIYTKLRVNSRTELIMIGLQKGIICVDAKS